MLKIFKKPLFQIFGSLFCLISCFVPGLTACNKTEHYQIDIILPIEHKALTQIVQGFEEKMPKSINGKQCLLKVHNAHGDVNVMKNIIQTRNPDLVVAVGTSTTQLAFSLRSGKKTLGLATLPMGDADQNHITLTDEIAPYQKIELIKSLGIKNLTLIHSINERFQNEAQLVEQACLDLGVGFHKKSIFQLQDLYKVVKSVNTEAILILKDHLVASGIATVVSLTEIPIITSDEGTVSEGATVALAVSEKSIGEKGAELAALMLEDKAVSSTSLDHYQIFINPKKFPEKHSLIEAFAKSKNMPITKVS